MNHHPSFTPRSILKSLPSTAARGLVLVLLLIGILYATITITYNRQFNALRSALEDNRYEIIGQWRHEDTTLEDFGFTARTQVSDFAIDILDGSDVRTPNDRITSVYVRFVGENFSEAQPIAFDSDYWRSLRLPNMNTLADLLKHMPQTLAALRTQPLPAPAPDHPRMSFPYKPYAVLRIPTPPAVAFPAR